MTRHDGGCLPVILHPYGMTGMNRNAWSMTVPLVSGHDRVDSEILSRAVPDACARLYADPRARFCQEAPHRALARAEAHLELGLGPWALVREHRAERVRRGRRHDDLA